MKYQGIDTNDMDAGEAFELLEKLGCDEDPIKFRGTEMTPRDIYYEMDIDGKVYRLEGVVPASQVRIGFYGDLPLGQRTAKKRSGWRPNSNLKQMVEDRIRLKRSQHPKRDPYDSMNTRELREACEHEVFQILGIVRAARSRGRLVELAKILKVPTDEED